MLRTKFLRAFQINEQKNLLRFFLLFCRRDFFPSCCSLKFVFLYNIHTPSHSNQEDMKLQREKTEIFHRWRKFTLKSISNVSMHQQIRYPDTNGHLYSNIESLNGVLSTYTYAHAGHKTNPTIFDTRSHEK
jgi:hypothetical protein